MIIKAIFKGERDLLGYVVGQQYTLSFVIERGNIIIRCLSLTIYNGGYCPYQSLKLFLNNWEVL